jgi:transposase
MNAREHSTYLRLLTLARVKSGVLPYERKRQEEFIAFLEYLDRHIPSYITTIHLVLDNLSVHKGKKVQAWVAKHPRFLFHYPPVHCSWMNQVEQWFSRKFPHVGDFR